MSKTQDIFDGLVENFKQELRSGVNPFRKIVAVKNIAKREYTGFNKWHLSGVVSSNEYNSTTFATFNQIRSAKGSVKKGEKGYPVFFWAKLFVFKNGKKEITTTASSKEEALKYLQKNHPVSMSDFIRSTMFIKHFTVFNLDQTEGIESDVEDSILTHSLEGVVDSLDVNKAFSKMPFYDDTTDTLKFDPQTMDDSLLEPIVSATGHHTRTDREFPYEEESLVCAIGASFLAAMVGFEPSEQFDESLVEKWLDVLDRTPMFLYKAASIAQKSIDYIAEHVSEKSIAA